MEYVRVDEAPEKLKDNEFVVHKPNFQDEISASRGRRSGVKGVVTIRGLRDTFMVITDRYDNTVNPYRLNLQKFENLVFDGDAAFSAIILDVIRANDLDLVDKAVEQELLKRDPKVNKIFYVSPDLEGSGAFLRLGFNMKDEKKSPKKTVE
jgi:hypothetical protein